MSVTFNTQDDLTSIGFKCTKDSDGCTIIALEDKLENSRERIGKITGEPIKDEYLQNAKYYIKNNQKYVEFRTPAKISL
jgi:hypothetical protein